MSRRLSDIGRTHARRDKAIALDRAEGVLETFREEKSKDFPIQVTVVEGVRTDLGEITKLALCSACTTKVVHCAHKDMLEEIKMTSSR